MQDKMLLLSKFEEYQALVADFLNNKHRPEYIQEYLDKRNALEDEIIILMKKLGLAPRVCSECNKPIWEGFYDGDYYCSEDCLHKHYTPEEWAEATEDSESECYWIECTVDDIDEDIIIYLEENL